MKKSVEMWVSLFETLDATNTSSEEVIASRILSDMVGYNKNSKFRRHDAEMLAAALEAYAKLLQQHGVVIP